MKIAGLLIAALVATAGRASADSLTVRELEDRIEIAAPGALLRGASPAVVDGWVEIELSGRLANQSVKLADTMAREVVVRGGDHPRLRIDIRGGQTKTRLAAARTWVRFAGDDAGLVIVVPHAGGSAGSEAALYATR